LDRRLKTRDLDDLRAVPPVGWIRAIRSALGMSQADLAARVGVTPAAVAALERSERQETITLGKLAELARAMDCTVVYALVPNTTLDDTVHRQAQRRAAEALDYVGRTMELEAQGLEGSTDELLEREAQRVIDDQRVWRRP
jgi:predicted DNA-binding mobile mystery protein A